MKRFTYITQLDLNGGATYIILGQILAKTILHCKVFIARPLTIFF